MVQRYEEKKKPPNCLVYILVYAMIFFVKVYKERRMNILCTHAPTRD